VSGSDEVRPPRWRFRIVTRVTIQPSGRAAESMDGETENASVSGLRVRLPREVPVGSHISLSLQEGAGRAGVVRWVAPHETSGYLHGIELDKPLERHSKVSRPLARLRCRLFFRRLLLGSIALGLMALAAAGLVWLLEAMRAYNPQYYEPKDVERERYEAQHPSDGVKQQAPPR
jgi:PilZ domain